ncbi:MAG: hypothetical protein A2Z34_00120 [Planctomycetes bacterium RBG_16_59_8]|nr:MAG: hypothetical protein A2Z34_00120 [Planctomycetes bacterium RBG_16_59_8]
MKPWGNLALLVVAAIGGCDTASRPDSAHSTLDLHVRTLAEGIGERNIDRYENLERAAKYIERQLSALGYSVSMQNYMVREKLVGNIEAERHGSGSPGDIVLVGAHYDSAQGTPGADDNATGVAGMLEIARLLSKKTFSRTIRFVAFVNEEPPYFQTEQMGSVVYAKYMRKRNESVVAMIALETIGYYSDEEGSQRYPSPLDKLYPSRGNFIAFVGNDLSKDLLKRCGHLFREETTFPVECALLPDRLPGVGWSDHWSFWQEEYPAIMVTDTAPFRNPHYHKASDLPDKLDIEKTERVVAALARVVERLADNK